MDNQSTEMQDHNKEAVQRGIEYLDEHEPGWHEKIDLSRFDLLSSKQCVLGQLYGDFWDVYDKFGSNARWMGDHGFYAVTVHQSWRGLEEEWVRQIKARQQPA